MFHELAPYLRHRAVLFTVTHLGEDDQIRVNIIPKKLENGENEALTTPLSITGTAEELDAELPKTLVGYVAAHLQLKNSLDSAKALMDAAAKAAQSEARTKAKTSPKGVARPQEASLERTGTGEVAKPTEPAKSPARANFGLFDAAEQPNSTTSEDDDSEEDEILSELGEDAPGYSEEGR